MLPEHFLLLNPGLVQQLIPRLVLGLLPGLVHQLAPLQAVSLEACKHLLGASDISHVVTTILKVTNAFFKRYSHLSISQSQNSITNYSYKTFFMLNSTEHAIFPAHKC